MEAEEIVAEHLAEFKVYQEVAPDNAVEPFVIIRKTNEQDIPVIGGVAGTEIAQLQVDIYHKDSYSLSLEARKVRDRMRNLEGAAMLRGFNIPEPQNDLVRRVYDYRLEYDH